MTNLLFWPRLRVAASITVYALAILAGCVASPKATSTTTSLGDTVTGWGGQTEAVSGPLGVFAWTGAIAILGGLVALTLTRGAFGIRALVVGVGLILLNYAVMRYAHWVFIPVLIGTAAISITYAFIIVRAAWNSRKQAWAPKPESRS